MTSFLLSLAAIILTGCSSLGPNFQSLTAPSKDKAMVYVYRLSKLTGSVRSPRVTWNGEEKGDIVNGSFFFFEVKPGVSKIAQGSLGKEFGAFEVNLKAGQQYFVRVDLGTLALQEAVDSKGRSTGKACPSNIQTFRPVKDYSKYFEVLQYLDTRVLSSTCWPGFTMVTQDLALSEIVYTKEIPVKEK